MSDVCTGLSDKQPGVEGHIFNTVGSGVRGGGTPGYVTYGAAKRGLPQMTDSLVAELDGKTQGYDWPAAAEKDGEMKEAADTDSPLLGAKPVAKAGAGAAAAGKDGETKEPGAEAATTTMAGTEPTTPRAEKSSLIMRDLKIMSVPI